MSYARRIDSLVVPLLFAMWGCQQKAEEPLSSLAPKPLTPLAPVVERGPEDPREALHRVEPVEVFGEPTPSDAVVMQLTDEGLVRVEQVAYQASTPQGAQALRGLLAHGRPVVVVPSEEVYMAQLSAFWTILDEAGVSLWLGHRKGKVAFPIELKEEAAFEAWLDEVTPGRIRVIQRADGLELSTSVGKLPGVDPNGPSVPVRGGQLDIATARRGLQLLAERFRSAEEICFVPSQGTELNKVAEAMSANYLEMEAPTFERLFLVYGRLRSSPR